MDDANFVVLDTETTGLDHGDEIVEIAVVDAEGRTLLDERIRPSVPISPEAQAIHGITMESLADAPQWPDIAGKVRAVLDMMFSFLAIHGLHCRHPYHPYHP
mgnify:CR=1 FL=1